ncbi:MAG: hypothetical protein RMJ17_03105 [Candidatus Aenigmarchaeota archaeon]|nr:hypothetical protein [Candidatus Aenigmarchaeota archaeon]MDW8149555.1 hypothetical protein [Candidatus Aenigmarchaeota archaeon]
MGLETTCVIHVGGLKMDVDSKYLRRASDFFYLLFKRAKIASKFFDGISTEFSYLSRHKDLDLNKEFARLWDWLKSGVEEGFIPSFTMGQIEAILFLMKKRRKN